MRMRSFLYRCLLILCVAVITFFTVRWPFGSANAFQAAIRGHRMLVDPPAPIQMESGSSESAVVRVSNLTHFDLNIYGVQTACSCLSPPNLPVTISPRSITELPFKIFAGERVGLRSVPVRLFVEGEAQPVETEIEVVVSQPPTDF